MGKKKEAQKYTGILGEADKKVMFGTFMRNPTVYEKFKDILFSQTDTPPADRKFFAVLRVVKDHVDDTQQLPKLADVRSRFETATQSDPESLSTKEKKDALKFITWAFDKRSWGDIKVASNTAKARGASVMLQRYVEERLLSQIHETTQMRGRRIDNVTSYFANIQSQAAAIAALASPTSVGLFPEGTDWMKDGCVRLSATRLTFFDHLLGGGHAGGEIYAVLGPYASCKTTLAVMLSVKAADAAHTLTETTGVPHYVVHVTYEAPITELRQRYMSYAAEIHRESLTQMTADGIAAFSSADNLKEYEKVLFKDAIESGAYQGGELERFEAARHTLHEHVIVLDYSGSDVDHPGAGNGYVPEIAAAIASELQSRGENAKLYAVVLDYAGAMVNQHVMSRGLDNGQTTALLQNTALALRKTIAGPYDCPVWVFHQFTGAANQRTSSARMHHTDAGGCKSFAENADFAFTISAQTPQGLCKLTATKHRRTGHIAPLVLRIRGELCKVDPCDGTFVVNPNTQQIERAADAHNAEQHAVESTESAAMGLQSFEANEDDENDD